MNKICFQNFLIKNFSDRNINLLCKVNFSFNPKALDIILNKKLQKLIQPPSLLGYLKSITFYNLAQIYQERRQFNEALKALSIQIELDELLINEKQYFQEIKKNIHQNYLNRALVLSELKNYQASIDNIHSALSHLNSFESVQQSLKKDENEEKKQEDNQSSILILFNFRRNSKPPTK